MAKSYQQLWEEQKKKGVYQTTSGGKVYANETAKIADQAVQAAVQSANQQKQSGTYKTTSGGTVKTSSGSKSSSTPKGPVYTPPVIPKVNFQIPTPKAIVTPAAVKSAVAATVPNTAAVDAYKKKLAATQRRTTNQAAYDDETTKKTKPDVEIVAAQEAVDPRLYNGYGQWMLPDYNTSGLVKTNLSSPVASESFGQMFDPKYEYKTPAEQKAEEEARKQAEQDAYNRWLAQQQAVVEEPLLEEELLEEELEEEVDPLEEYLQAMLDAQNAQYQALIDAIRGQSGALNAQYDANAANLYELYRRGQLAFPELMSGTATGMADSFSLQNNLNFQNNLNDNELARASALQALQTEANQYQADAELQAAQTAADWAKMMYQQRLANQNKSSGTKTTTTTKKDEDDGYMANTIPEVKQYLELQLGMGNNMTRDNIISILKDLYKAKAISKTLAQDTAAEFGIGLYL